MNDGYVRQRRNLISICVFISLAILGGAKMNPYFPYHIDRPYVAEIFKWLGYAYFWYRVLIYQPDNLANHF